MNFDSSLHQNNVVRNILLKCGLPVLLMALLGVFVIYWTDQAVDCFLVTKDFIFKWLDTVFWNTFPLVEAINDSSFWRGVVEYFLMPIRPVVFPLSLLLVCGSMICGCAINKLKLRNITDYRFERLVTIYRPITILPSILLVLSLVAETNVDQSYSTTVLKYLFLTFGALLLNLTLHRVEKVNGDLYKKGRSNGL